MALDVIHAEKDPVAVVNNLAKHEVPGFLRDSIREKKLTTIVNRLNREVLSADPRRRTAAKDALTRIGFI